MNQIKSKVLGTVLPAVLVAALSILSAPRCHAQASAAYDDYTVIGAGGTGAYGFNEDGSGVSHAGCSATGPMAGENVDVEFNYTVTGGPLGGSLAVLCKGSGSTSGSGSATTYCSQGSTDQHASCSGDGNSYSFAKVVTYFDVAPNSSGPGTLQINCFINAQYPGASGVAHGDMWWQ